MVYLEIICGVAISGKFAKIYIILQCSFFNLVTFLIAVQSLLLYFSEFFFYCTSVCVSRLPYCFKLVTARDNYFSTKDILAAITHKTAVFIEIHRPIFYSNINLAFCFDNLFTH